MKIYVLTLSGTEYTFHIDGEATVKHLKRLIASDAGIPVNQQQLHYAGKRLEDDAPLRAYNIQDYATLHMLLRDRAKPPPVPSDQISSHEQSVYRWNEQAKSGDFDEDLDIIDPQTYYGMLEDLEREVVMRSEFFRREGAYWLNSKLDPRAADNNAISNIPTWLLIKLQTNGTLLKAKVKSIVTSFIRVCDFKICMESFFPTTCHSNGCAASMASS